MTDASTWATAFADLVRHGNIRGESVYAYIQGVADRVTIGEARAYGTHLELTDVNGSNWLIAHPSGVVLRWMRTQDDGDGTDPE